MKVYIAEANSGTPGLERECALKNFEGHGDDSGDATDDGADVKKDPRKSKDIRDRAKTVPQKTDEQDAVGSPGRKNLRDSYRRPLQRSNPGVSRGRGHTKRKGRNQR